MPPNSQRFTVLTRRLLASIAGIGQALKEQTAAITQSIEAAKPKQKVSEEVNAEVHISSPIETRKTANDARNERVYQCLTLAVSTLTLIAVIIYAWLAYLQWQEMIGATNAASDAVHEARISRQQNQQSFIATVNQFRLDQRAWVGTADPPIIVFQQGQLLSIKIPIKNTGKTPALDLTTVLATRGRLPKQIADFNDMPRPTGHGILQPGGTVYLVSDAVTPLTKENFDALRFGNVIEWAYGRITYNDIFGCPHWTTFAQTLNTSALGLDYAGIQNEVDHNKCPN